ncbi:MAG: 1,4-alpha-glucan branching protein GlgB [Candidatus Eisenbacteria bacterium]|nr:1,4-alpha-glucan branching protein GlgB [Candidatus Eisenbacteria bacterium]
MREAAPEFVPRSYPGATFSLFSQDDIYLFREGTHYRLWEKLGSHLVSIDGVRGVYFAIWAPNATEVSVVGDWNEWKPGAHPLRPLKRSGIWEGFIPGVQKGAVYKYHLRSRFQEEPIEKADPFAHLQEMPPQTASVVWDLDFQWTDQEWMAGRAKRQSSTAPMSIYELHLGSWRRVPENGRRSLRYRELAPGLAHYVQSLGFTHVELLPIMEHPFFGSWGYQTTGYFAPSARQGRPQDFMHLVDVLHQHGIGVILDWVPSHFPDDPHGLSRFDGTYLFEHADPRQGFHPDWNTLIWNYGRPEVRSFLISSALFWLGQFHADGIRVDAVASMLYLDYSRKHGEWVANEYGGRENLQAIRFLRQMNEAIHKEFAGTVTIAEESTSWPMVSRPTHLGGLGFDMKWDMGWMHDTLRYLARGPVHRKFHHNEMTFRLLYAFQEHFVLALSHDEVVHGKYSLPEKMPGDDWQKFANLRLLFGYMFAQPGRKHIFMGLEFGQRREWNHDDQLDWDLLQEPLHDGLKRWVGDVNRLYAEQPALHELDDDPDGFEWIDCNDSEQSVLTLLRKGNPGAPYVVVAINFTPIARLGYRVGVPERGFWREALNSNAREYGGTGMGNQGGFESEPEPFHGREQSLLLTLPPLGVVFFVGPDRPEREMAPPPTLDAEASPAQESPTQESPRDESAAPDSGPTGIEEAEGTA